MAKTSQDDAQPQNVDVMDTGEGVEVIDENEIQQQLEDKLQLVGTKLAKQRDEWVRMRYSAGVDKRWLDDVDQYHGRDPASKAASHMMEAVEQGYPVTTKHTRPHRSTVFIGITRDRTNKGESRLVEIVLPVDDRNWGISSSPLPKLASAEAVQQALANIQSPPGAPPTGGPGGPGAMGAMPALGATGQPQTPGQQPSTPGAVSGLMAGPMNGPQPGGPQPNQQLPGTPGQGPGAPAAGSMAAPGQQPSQQSTLNAQLEAIKQQADEAAEAMEREIDQALTECEYNAEVRKMAHWAAMLGTGVIKGPIVTNRTRKAWTRVVDQHGKPYWTLEIVEEKQPASYAVDPRNCFPDPTCGEDIHDGRGIYEREKQTDKQVRDLAKQPGYKLDALRAVLEEGPKQSATMEELRLDDESTRDLMNKNYEKWVFWGALDRDDAITCGIKVAEDPLVSINVCVEFINSTIVKVFVNPLDGGELPYDFFVWERVTNSPWGYGVPYLMRSQQKVINAGWRQMMDNMGICSGPQIVVKAGLIQPADKQWELTPRKIWFATDDTQDVRQAFTAFEFNSHQQDLANLIKMGMDLLDQENGIPSLLDGQRQVTPDTVGGMQMLMNSMNVVLRRLVKQFDDQVTRRHIRRYYDFFMLYSDKEEIKGDFTIIARGSSALLIRDIQNQAFLGLLQAGANPVYGMYLDTEKLFKKALQAQHIVPAEVMKSDAEIAQIKAAQAQAAASGANAPPQIQAAKLKAQADVQKAQIELQQDQQDLQLKREIAMQEAQSRMAELEVQKQIAMLTLATKQNVSLEQIKADLASTALKEQTKKDIFAAEQHLKLTTGSGVSPG